MLLTQIDAEAWTDYSPPDVQLGQHSPKWSQEIVGVKLRFMVEHADGPISFNPTREGIMEMMRACKAPAGLTDSSLVSSEQPPNIVVSVRPSMAGAPAATTVTRPGGTSVIPFQWVAIAPSGEPVQLDVGIEVCAPLSPAQ